MDELHNHNASIGQLYEHTKYPFVFCQVLRGEPPKIANKNVCLSLLIIDSMIILACPLYCAFQ